jgi:hypothetical protein
MITEEEYLKAQQLIKDYVEQLKQSVFIKSVCEHDFETCGTRAVKCKKCKIVLESF